MRRLDPALEWTLPYLKHLLALPAAELESEGLDQAQRKRRTIEAVKTFVLRGAQERPLVILVEDLQWIDRNSEELCRTLIDGLASHRVLLLGTYRPGYTPPWQDRSSHQRLVLDRLSDEETIEIVTALLDATELAPALRALVLERTEGNPFFVEELTRPRVGGARRRPPRSARGTGGGAGQVVPGGRAGRGALVGLRRGRCPTFLRRATR